MYRESETIVRSPFADQWECLRVKFRASFPGQKSVLRCFDTAVLDEVRTTASQLCFSVESAEAMALLDSEYGHFLQQLWFKITGHNVKVVILTRATPDARPAEIEKQAETKMDRTLSSVGMYMLQEEATVEKPPPVGVLSPTISLGIENFVDAELRRHKRFTPALCIGYVYGRYNVDQAMLKSRRRDKDNKVGMTEIRRIAVYLTRALTSLNKNEIGRQFNGMTGKFVAVAIEEIDYRRENDEVFDAEIQGHIEYLRGRERAVLWTLRSR